MVTTRRELNSREQAILSLKLASIDLDARIPIKMVVYGPYGCGKTTFMAKVSPKKIFLVTAEHGAQTLRDNPELRKRVKPVHYISLEIVLSYMRLINEGAEGFENYTGVGLDTATSITSLIRQNISAKKGGSFPMETETPFGDLQGDLAASALEFKEHGAVEAIWRDFVTHVKREALNCDLIVSAQEKVPSVEEARLGATVGPKMPDGPREQLLADADFVVRLFWKGDKQMVLTSRVGNYEAKNRAGLRGEMRVEDFIKAVREWSKGRKADAPENTTSPNS